MKEIGLFKKYLLYLFPPKSSKNKKMAELVAIWKELKELNPQFYDPFHEKLSGKLGSLLVLLKKSVEPIKAYSQMCQWKPDYNALQLIWEHILSEKNLKLEDLSFSYLLSLNKSGDLEEVETTFQSNLAKIRLEDMEFWDSQINELINLQKLAVFPFHELLVHWDRGDGQIASAKADPCKTILLRLNRTLKPLNGNFSHNLWSELFFPGLPKRGFKDLYLIRSRLLSGKHLDLVLKALYKGQQPTLKQPKSAQLYFKDYKTRIQEKFNNEKQKKVDNIKVQKLNNFIKDVFGDENLILPVGYNVTNSNLLKKMGFKSLKYTIHIKLIKNFFNIHYIGNLRDALHYYQLDFSGKYSEPETDLFELLDQYKLLEENIIKWEKVLESSGFSTFGSLDTIVKMNFMLPPVKQILKTRLEQLEKETLPIITQFSQIMKDSNRILRLLAKSLGPLQNKLSGIKKQHLLQTIEAFELYCKNSKKMFDLLENIDQ